MKARFSKPGSAQKGVHANKEGVSPVYAALAKLKKPTLDQWKKSQAKKERRKVRIAREEKAIAAQRQALKDSTKAPSWYALYLQSEHWRIFRLNILSVRGAKCEDCGDASRRVQLHHLTYIRLNAERPEDVRVLCDSCHCKRHGIRPPQNGKLTGMQKGAQMQIGRAPKGQGVTARVDTLNGRSSGHEQVKPECHAGHDSAQEKPQDAVPW